MSLQNASAFDQMCEHVLTTVPKPVHYPPITSQKELQEVLRYVMTPLAVLSHPPKLPPSAQPATSYYDRTMARLHCRHHQIFGRVHISASFEYPQRSLFQAKAFPIHLCEFHSTQSSILAAGYGTRLQRDIAVDSSGRFEKQKGVSKALLPLAGTPLIGHWLALLDGIADSLSSDAFVICNGANHTQFLDWASSSSFPRERIFNDGTLSNETRLGATTDLSLAISHFSLDDPSKYKAVLVVAGDTLFLKDFSLESFLLLATSASTTPAPCLVASYTVEKDIDTLKTGILTTNAADFLPFGATSNVIRVTSLLEKPHPNETTSRLACPCFYYLSSPSLPFVHQFVKDSIAKGEGLEARDAAGKLIAWLVTVYPVYTVGVSGRLDIGGLQSYIDAEEYLKQE
ncbi:UNVERIFIED_CONTAM: hypothetical protein HDU68_003367 [Siphonaria sp. JEL0065]|nr:hypothetical protein HDU68_003367 [Siphonaria sp. JEL0065]